MDKFLGKGVKKRLVPSPSMDEAQEDDVVIVEPNSKCMKPSKTYAKFKPEWTKTYSFIKSSTRGPQNAFCSVCLQHLSIKCGGIDDIKKHGETAKHQRAALDSQSTKKMDGFLFSHAAVRENLTVIRAESLFTQVSFPFIPILLRYFSL